MIHIVYGPKASGKTRNKQRIAEEFGCEHVIDGVTPYRSGIFRDDVGLMYSSVEDNTLVLTCMSKEETIRWAMRMGETGAFRVGPWALHRIDEVLKRLGIDADPAP